MEGDKVEIVANATEIEGKFFLTSKISEKPQFMLDEEYRQQIIACAVEAIRVACTSVYPNNEGTRLVLAQAIANMAIKGDKNEEKEI